MAIGATTTISPDASAIELLASATAINGAPSGGSAGLEINAVRSILGAVPRSVRIAALSTAGSGTMTVTLRLWQRLGALGWVVSKSLNAGSAIAETGTDTIGYSETVDVIGGADRIYLEITAIGGTATAVTGYAVVSRDGL